MIESNIGLLLNLDFFSPYLFILFYLFYYYKLLCWI